MAGCMNEDGHKCLHACVSVGSLLYSQPAHKLTKCLAHVDVHSVHDLFHFLRWLRSAVGSAGLLLAHPQGAVAASIGQLKTVIGHRPK